MSIEREKRLNLVPQFHGIIDRLAPLVKEGEILVQGAEGDLFMFPSGRINFVKKGFKNNVPSPQTNQSPEDQFKTALRNYALTMGADFDTANKFKRARLTNSLISVLVRKEQSFGLSSSERKTIFYSPLGV